MSGVSSEIGDGGRDRPRTRSVQGSVRACDQNSSQSAAPIDRTKGQDASRHQQGRYCPSDRPARSWSVTPNLTVPHLGPQTALQLLQW